MEWINKISHGVKNIIGIPEEYVRLVIFSVIVVFAIYIIKTICIKLFLVFSKNQKSNYLFNKRVGLFASLLTVLFLILIWETHIKNMMTLISFVSAGITISLREFILNFFAGIYIRMTKPFSLEDRIEINNLKGDVVNIKSTSFDLLEIGDRVNGEQSTGRIVHVPNSIVFSYPLKNYVKAFKYIWNELVIKVDLNSDIKKTKRLLYRIVRKNSVIQEIPDKMETQVNDASTDYRIYFNNLEPIIYTSVVDSHIELYIRYLVHPKKARNVENSIWLDIINEYKNGNIKIYEK